MQLGMSYDLFEKIMEKVKQINKENRQLQKKLQILSINWSNKVLNKKFWLKFMSTDNIILFTCALTQQHLKQQQQQ